MTPPIALRKRTIAALVGGRAAYRLAMYAPASAFSRSGADEFARYAAATGAVGWLFALPRAGRRRPRWRCYPVRVGRCCSACSSGSPSLCLRR
jgi:hypothetical protein